jgi:hypothetical protein
MTAVCLNERNALWNDLKDIEEVTPVGESDLSCLADVRDVLKRYGMQDRFGVALLHKHFELQPGEMLVEQTDKSARTLTISAMTPADVPATVGTIFRLDDGDGLDVFLGCMQYCGRDVQGNHNSFHQQR